ncbi:MAG: NAD(+)/NADH kinase [Clostridia bacterium]|nr:NAD(+)/NADH kinase [Clostridia bacterium]
MKKVAVITNFKIKDKADVAFAAAEKLVENGVTPLFLFYSFDNPGMKERAEKTGAAFLSNQKLYAESDMVIVVGGDGTIIDAVRNSVHYGIPVLGINMGRLGYLAELEVFELDKLSDIVAGRYRTEKRTMLKIELISGGRTVKTCTALNDAVVTNGSVARIVDLQLSENGNLVGNYRSDGMVISTPTGSTAYSLSAGGPILDAGVRAFVVTPICAHSFAARPMVFPDSAKLELKNTSTREPFLILTADGKTNLRLGRDDVAVITKAEQEALFVRVKPAKFYSDFARRLESI